MKRCLTWSALLMTGAGIGIVVCRAPLTADPDAAGVRSAGAGPTLERVRELSSLTTLTVDVADATVTELRGHTGGVKVVLVVRGEVAVGVDLAAAKLQVNPSRRAVVVTLPEPSVQFVRLDQERTTLIGVWSDGLWWIAPGATAADAAAVNAAYRDAQRRVVDAADDPALNHRARVRAERVLHAFFESLDWESEVRWAYR